MSQLLAAGSVRALDVGDSVSDGLSTVARFVPKFIAFLIILVIGYIVARFLAKAVDKVLERVGFDRAVERGGVGRALRNSRYDASDLVSKLVYYAILLLTLQMAFGVFGPNPVSDLLSGVVAWLPKAIVAIVIVVVAAAIANAVREIVSAALGGISYGRILANIAAVFILGLGVIAALNQIGVATTVTLPVLITVLATIGGILIVGVGGGLVRPMQDRWTRWLNRMESDAPMVRQHAAAYQRGREDTAAAARQPVQATHVRETQVQPAATGAAAPPAAASPAQPAATPPAPAQPPATPPSAAQPSATQPSGAQPPPAAGTYADQPTIQQPPYRETP
jgi:Conserved TM helix